MGIQLRDKESSHDSAVLPTPSVAMRGGLSGVFIDFDLLPRLLARAEKTDQREKTVEDWSEFLESVGFEEDHLDLDEFPRGLSAADCTAADAWRFAERMNFIGPAGLTAAGFQVAAFAEMGQIRRHNALAPLLATGVETKMRGHGDVPIVDLLRQAAAKLGKTTNLWARACPGLIPAEVGAIVHWACVNRRRAEELVKTIVSWRDVAMHRYPTPDPSDKDSAGAVQLHFDRVSEFYLEHPFLGEKVPWSFGEELALSRLLGYCGLLRERTPAPRLIVLTAPQSDGTVN